MSDLVTDLRRASRARRRANENFKQLLARAYATGMTNPQIAAATEEKTECVRVRRSRHERAAQS